LDRSLSLAGMRLLNTSTLEFSEFFDENIPGYAILSHRWESGDDGRSEEVSYEDFVARRRPSSRGTQKIKNFCHQATTAGYNWGWVDTCCIDKRSSAKLSEAINSMFKWYQRSAICYVYLSDVIGMQDIEQSQWFTRGWTLQELLAPGHEEFLNRNWDPLGTRESLGQQILHVTGIDRVFLANSDNSYTQRGRVYRVRTAPIALRMSWASKRRTSRAEDMAYCLLGLFGINMSLLYGEGRSAAFRRLQLEIITRSDDVSIFAWTEGNRWTSGILASSPRYFDACTEFKPLTNENPDHEVLKKREPYQFTNKGLRMQVHLLKLRGLFEVLDQVYGIPINCEKYDCVQPSRPVVVPVHTYNERMWHRVGSVIELTDSQWQELLVNHAEGHHEPVDQCVKCRLREHPSPMNSAHPLSRHALRLEDCPLRNIYVDIYGLA